MVQGGRGSAARGYGVAVAATFVVLLARIWFEVSWGDSAPLPAFMLAVTLAAAYGGLGPGFLATVLSALSGGFFLLPPRHALSVHVPSDRLDLVVFVVVGICISLMIERARRALSRSRETEQALRAARAFAEQGRAQYEAIADRMTEGLVVLDGEGRLLKVNPAALAFHGFSREDEVRGKHFSEMREAFEVYDAEGRIVPPEAWPLSRAFSGETFRDAEYRVRCVDDGRVWYASYGGTAIRDGGGRVTLAIITMRDVTAQRRTEEALRENEARFRRAIMGAPFPAMIHAEDGQVVDLNHMWSEITGFSHEEIPTTGAWTEKAYAEPQRSEARASIARLYAIDDKVDEGEFAPRTASGEARIWHFGSAPLGRDGRGRRLVLSVASDITAQKQAEQALRESLARLAASEERLRFAMVSAQAGSWDWDIRTDRRVWSEESYRLYGLEPGKHNLSYHDWLSAVHPDDRAMIDGYIRRVLAQHVEVYRAEFRVLHPTLGVRWLSALGSVTYDDDGTPIRMAGINRDITEQKRIEHERELLLDSERAARAEAERANRMKDEFLAMISHELRTPLNAILGWTQLLRRPDATPEHRARCLEIIERNTRLQAQLISDLLDVSRITVGKLHLELSSVDLPLVVEAAIDACRSAAEAKEIELRAAIDPAPASLRGDPGRLQQAVTNLVTNAIKFTPKGGRVMVSLRRRGDRAEIAVRDTGQGIAPEFLPYLFDRFRQADASMARHHGGLGLGLAIVKHLVELHEGEVRAESAGLGAGATFTITLPCEAGWGRVRPAPSRPGEALGLQGVRVLVVDDEADAREMTKRVLEEHGSTVLTAASGPEALDALDAVAPDVLVSDLGMPGMDGYALIHAVRAGGRRLPAVAVTAFARPEDRQRALSAGYQAHLAKPVEPSELVAAVASLRREAA